MPERDGPLLTQARKLLSLGPPSLTALVARLEEVEEYEAFVALVREYLPEWEGEILRERSPALQMAAFADRFEERYFPLAPHFRERDVEGYGQLTLGIPIIPRGISYEDYHDLPNWALGFRLMAYLLAPPDWAEEGARVPLGESLVGEIPKELLERVPEGGLPREEAHCLLDGTPYQALALWADMLNMDTGIFFLDIEEEYPYYEGLPDWDKGTVEELTREWQQAQVMLNKVADLREHLAGDPPVRFGELLDFIEKRREEVNGQA